MGQRHYPGQSLAEYGLVAALIGIAGLGALTFMANNFVTQWPELKQKMFYGKSGANGTEMALVTPPGDPTSGSTGDVPSNPLGTMSDSLPIASDPIPTTSSSIDLAVEDATKSSIRITLGSGATFTIDSYPTELAQTLETSGANGTTQMILAAFESIIQQLEESGQLNSSDANVLQELADIGYQMASAEKALEDLAASSTNNKDFMSKSVTWT